MDYKDFKEGHERLEDFSSIVRDLSKERGVLNFLTKRAHLISFIQKYFPLKDEELRALTGGSHEHQAVNARNFLYETKNDFVRDTQDGFADIAKDLGEDLEDIVFSAIPLTERDLANADDLDLDNVITSYRDEARDKQNELGRINKTRDPLRYEAIESLKNEYEKYADAVGKYKNMIIPIAKYKNLIYHLVSNEGKPNTVKIKSLFNDLLDELEERDTDDNNRRVVKIARELSKREEHLLNYYEGSLIDPAKDKARESAKNHNLENYLTDTVKAMNTDKANLWLNGLYYKKIA